MTTIDYRVFGADSAYLQHNDGTTTPPVADGDRQVTYKIFDRVPVPRGTPLFPVDEIPAADVPVVVERDV